MEDVVKEWALKRSNKGLRVKDQYIRAKARRVYMELHLDDNSSLNGRRKGADDDVSTTKF
jgi:Tc5 transposase DNA-binding domain